MLIRNTHQPPHTRNDSAPPAAQPDTLVEPAARRKLDQARSKRNRDAAEVARVADDHVRPTGDECVVLLHGHRPGDKGAVACEAEYAACELRGRCAHDMRSARCQQGEDALGGGARAISDEDGRGFGGEVPQEDDLCVSCRKVFVEPGGIYVCDPALYAANTAGLGI